MDCTEKADLILRGLGGEHPMGWIPGGDHKAAISHIFSGCAGWSGPTAGTWGSITPKGIGSFPRFGLTESNDALLFVIQ